MIFFLSNLHGYFLIHTESQMNQANKTRAVHLCLLMITNKVLIHTGELQIAEKKLFDFID